MARHIFSIGNHAPMIVNAIIEIPRTEAMNRKLEVDLASGDIVCAEVVSPPLETHWHYGSIPETLGDEGEALDVLIVDPPSCRRWTRDEVTVRPIGILKILDDWETCNDKIVAVPHAGSFEHIRGLDEIPPVHTSEGQRISFREAVETFFGNYKRAAPLEFKRWGDATAALAAISAGRQKYRWAPLAQSPKTAHVYPIYLHIFLPPPPKHFAPTRYVEDIVQIRQLFKVKAPHPEYGYVVSGLDLKMAIRASGHNISRSRLIGHDRERLIEERLRMAELLTQYGAKVYTASNDCDWLSRASKCGVAANLVEHESYEIENVAGISAQDLKTIQFHRADGTRVIIAEAGIDEHAIVDRLREIGVGGEGEPCKVLNVPDRLIPWKVPARGSKRMTQLTNWIDYGLNIWPDRNNLPHLVIGGALQRIAEFQHREAELQRFIDRCRHEFEGVHILSLNDGMPYGSPTNSIDVGTAILCNSSLSDKSRDHKQAVLGRPIDNSLHIDENAPGLRCATVPIDKAVYSLLLEGDPLHHASVDRTSVDPFDPMDSFFDVDGLTHQSLAARVLAKREELLAQRQPHRIQSLKRHGPVRG